MILYWLSFEISNSHTPTCEFYRGGFVVGTGFGTELLGDISKNKSGLNLDEWGRVIF